MHQFKYWKWTNEKIRRHTPAKVRLLACETPPDREWILAPPDPVRERARALLGGGLPYAHGPGVLPGSQPYVAEVFKVNLQEALDRVAASFNQRYGMLVAEFTIEMKTVEGEHYPVGSFPIDSDSTKGPGGS